MLQVGSEEGAALKDLGVRALVQQLVSASDASMWRCDSLLVRCLSGGRMGTGQLCTPCSVPLSSFVLLACSSTA